MPMGLPSSMTGRWEMPCSRSRLRTAPMDRWLSMNWGALVMISLMGVFPHCWVTAPWMTFSSVMNPASFFSSKTGSCLSPLWIMSLAALLKESSGSIFGAGFIRDFTFVVAGSSLDRFIILLAMMALNLPSSSSTARTGFVPFLKSSMHFDSGSFSLTVTSFLEKTSPTEIVGMVFVPRSGMGSGWI